MLSLFRNTGHTSSLFFENYTLQLTDIYNLPAENTLQTFQSSFSINCKCWLNNTHVESMIAFSTNIQTLQNRYTMAKFNKEKTHTFFFFYFTIPYITKSKVLTCFHGHAIRDVLPF